MSNSETSQERMVSELAGDEDMLELVEMYIEELPDRVASLEKTLADADKAGLASLAHQIKGSAGGYGFPALTDAATELETSAKADAELKDLAEQINGIADMCRRASAHSEDS